MAHIVGHKIISLLLSSFSSLVNLICGIFTPVQIELSIELIENSMGGHHLIKLINYYFLRFYLKIRKYNLKIKNKVGRQWCTQPRKFWNNLERTYSIISYSTARLYLLLDRPPSTQHPNNTHTVHKPTPRNTRNFIKTQLFSIPNPSSTKPPNRRLPPPFQKEKRKPTHREIPNQTQQPNLKHQNPS